MSRAVPPERFEKLPTAAYEFTSVAKTEEKEFEHRVIAWEDPRNRNTIEGYRRKDQTVKDLEELVRRSDALEYCSKKMVEKFHGGVKKEREHTLEIIDEKIERTEERIENARIAEEIDHWESQLKAYEKIREEIASVEKKTTEGETE